MRPTHIADRTGLRHITPGKTGTSGSGAAEADPDAPVTGGPDGTRTRKRVPCRFRGGSLLLTARTRDQAAAFALRQFVGFGSGEPPREFAPVRSAIPDGKRAGPGIRSRRGDQRPRTLRTGHPVGSAGPW
ncbi:hypothetical protein GCM10009525_87690 [Streptosporangium amethystogenes subsp. fukuiense]